ncbi:MAG: DUF962 domain-containing protein [Sandaracinaceae bacterium]|nr:DUF962 domain-containing protein [Sandaracinaceae bacterium]
MISKLSELLAEKKNRDLALLAGGAVTLMAGGKLTPIAMFLAGMKGLEDEWRKAHPDFHGSLAERFQLAIEHYDATHQHPTNRLLHTVGIPMVLGGFVGMLAAPRYSPPWWIANGSWTAGWALNFVGHGLYEKGEPAFATDPLGPIAGPVWDFVRLRDKLFGAAAPEAHAHAHADAAPTTHA